MERRFELSRRRFLQLGAAAAGKAVMMPEGTGLLPEALKTPNVYLQMIAETKEIFGFDEIFRKKGYTLPSHQS